MFRISKFFSASLLVLAMCACALAQTYMPPPPMPGSPTYTPPKHGYGNGAAIGAAVGGGAAATALYFGIRHHHRQVVGCVTPDGKNLTTDDGKHNYQIAGTEQINAGEHVSVVGKKEKDSSGIDRLEIQSVTKHMGQCEKQAALIEALP